MHASHPQDVRTDPLADAIRSAVAYHIACAALREAEAVPCGPDTSQATTPPVRSVAGERTSA